MPLDKNTDRGKFFRRLLAEGYHRLRKAKTIDDFNKLKSDWKHTMKLIDRELWRD